MAVDETMRVAVVTMPDQIDQEWIDRLGQDPRVGWLERVAILSTGLEMVQQSRPDVVIVDRPPLEAEEFIRQIFTTLPSTICIALTSLTDINLVRRLMMAGARDVLVRPVRHVDVLQSLSTVMQIEQDRRSRQLVTSDRQGRGRGKFVVVISPKGGAGTTVVSTNMAVALRQISSGRVALADFGLQFGHVGTHLNLFSRHTLQNLLAKSDEIDDTILAGVMQQHGSGVHVLLAPSSPEVAGEITQEQISAVLDSLLLRYSYVIADTWCVLDEVTMALLGRADDVLVVTTPEIPALKNVKFFLEYMTQHQLTRGRVSIVLNRFPSVDGVSLEDVQQHLRHPVSANIPSAGQLMAYSINRGVPVVLSHPQSWAGQSLRKLAAYVAGEQVKTITMEPDKGKGKGRENGQPRRGFMWGLRRQA
ncbi:AAA family ATPase [Oscillochloris sp. ZM17-4]|uniref:AAA family ATPase n=1 Tax=Oscillochloris sp. ZM17-4 TaxID=2866714 RepID=UPI001C72A4DB|nr:AAA family ATPase [Oscillochloris sp. ZM17-4]